MAGRASKRAKAVADGRKQPSLVPAGHPDGGGASSPSTKPGIRERLGRSGVFRRVKSAGKTGLALVGFGTLAWMAFEYKIDRDMEAAGDDGTGRDPSAAAKTTGAAREPRKRVLVIPFHRMKVVERKEGFTFDKLAKGLSSTGSGNPGEKVIEIEVKELVDIIHAAAADPECVALHGTFGQAHGFAPGGFAHVEEIRNAIRVFNESHRIHPEPNLSHDPNLPMARNGAPKASYAFADTFAHPTDSANKEYYLASEFTHVNLQTRGELSLLGIGISTPFIRGALDKYGVKAHVFKHGKYKNAANSLTETGYTKEHRESTLSMITSISDHNCMEIVRSRSLSATFDQGMWKAIRNYGTLTAQNALEVGLIDGSPRIDPLNALLHANKGEKEQAEMKAKWANEVEFGKFNAKEAISLTSYAQLLSRRDKAKKRKWKVYGTMEYLTEKSAATRLFLSALGYQSPFYNVTKEEYEEKEKATTKEKIAIVHLLGSIDAKMAQSVTSTLRKIRADTNIKCVILRVDSSGGSSIASETMLEECKDLDKPVICSMSNMAASGGYYVATDCDKIFAQPNTITGSIGVFGVKFDMSGLASQYGVKVQNIATGPLSSGHDQFQPLTRKMEDNINRTIDRIYDYFKEIVSSGRKLSLDEVEAIAQGRVWTGEQAVQVGLVDYLGGLDRAVIFAKKNYTSKGEAVVEVWPKSQTLSSATTGYLFGGGKEGAVAYLSSLWGEETLQENPYDFESPRYNLKHLLQPADFESWRSLLLGRSGHDQMSGIMLTANEADAITLALEEVPP